MSQNNDHFVLECLSCLNLCDQKLKEMPKTIKKINKEFSRAYKNIVNYKDLIESVLLYLQSNNRVITASSEIKISGFIDKYIDFPDKIPKELEKKEFTVITDTLKAQELEIFNLKQKLGENDYKKIFNTLNTQELEISKLKHDLNKFKSIMEEGAFEDIINKEYNQDCICYFTDNSKRLNTVNIDFSSVNIDYIGLPESLSSSAGYCMLPNNNLFYYGGAFCLKGDFLFGSKTVYLSSVYIIDIKQKAFIKISENRKPKGSVGQCCLYNYKVYIFGGYNSDGPIRDVEIFDTLTEVWTNGTELPLALYNASCTAFGDFIFVAGYNIDKCYKYNVKNNILIEISGLIKNNYKIVCYGFGKVYLFQNGWIFNYENTKSEVFKIINKTSMIPNYRMIGYSIRNTHYIYFLLEDMGLYRFNILLNYAELMKKESL
jgi:Kelch motif